MGPRADCIASPETYLVVNGQVALRMDMRVRSYKGAVRQKGVASCM